MITSLSSGRGNLTNTWN